MGKSVKEGIMPKELVRSQDHGREAILYEDGDSGKMTSQVFDMLALKVGWSKEGSHVQLAVIDVADDPDGFEAQHISLDREGLNHLIRLARKARDDAFGRDE